MSNNNEYQKKSDELYAEMSKQKNSYSSNNRNDSMTLELVKIKNLAIYDWISIFNVDARCPEGKVSEVTLMYIFEEDSDTSFSRESFITMMSAFAFGNTAVNTLRLAIIKNPVTNNHLVKYVFISEPKF
ncbi:hypothetical protein [uncultured Cedecea sp.]|uniref:hypothetical protein n=1 Tax=uncultured Cedecea sp. TaxID=988762 RepID=UPI002625FEF2|nr:hypothetical protein [uncultured Cedecea sp.]